MVTSININATESKDEMTINNDSSSVPSGFVLKLYQMVNEAPDDIIAVSRSILRCVCHFLQRNVACNEIFEFFSVRRILLRTTELKLKLCIASLIVSYLFRI